MSHFKALLLFTFALAFCGMVFYAYVTGPRAGDVPLGGDRGGVEKTVRLVYWDVPQWRGLSGTRLERHQGYDVWARRKIAEYEALHPEVEIEFALIPWAEETNKYLLAANAGEAPDVYYRDAGSVQDLARRGFIYPIDDYITQEDLDDWYEIALEELVVGGRLYAWPFFISFNAIAVNVDLLRERGVAHLLPGPPAFEWTYAQFLQAAKAGTFQRQKEDGSQEDVWGYVVHGIGSEHLYGMWETANGVANNYNYDETRAEIYTPQRLEVWNFLVDLIFRYGVSPPNSSGINYQEAWRLFLNRQLAMFPAGMWVISAAEAQAPEPFEIVCVQPPRGSYAPVQSQDPFVGAYVVSKRKDSTPERVKYAMDFARYLTNTRNDAGVVGNSTLPARKSVGNPYYGDPRFAVFFYILQNAKRRNPDWKFEHLHNLPLPNSSYYQMMISGQRTPEEVLREMHTELQRLVAEEQKAGYPRRSPRKIRLHVPREAGEVF